MRQFDYCMPSKIVFRHGATSDIKEYIQGSRVLIISDPFLYQNGTAKAIGGRLTGCQVAYFSDIEPNPSCESVDAAAQAARELGAQTVIGIGGGSSMDVAKIVSCLTTNEGSIYDYYSGGTRTFSPRQTRLICIPTTAGTGSEVTNVGVFTNRQTHVKMPMVNHQFWPDVSMLDPELTYTLPAPITASTGMDAFCHAIEAYWNRDSQPICDCLAVQAMKLVLANIKNAYDHPSDKQARGNMHLASLLAGIAFSQTRTTGIHAVSFPLTAEYGASHGTACAVTLPAFIRISGEKAQDKMTALAKTLGYDSIETLSGAIEALMVSMKMPVRLHELGVKEEAIPHIAQVGLSAAIIQLTPATMNEETVSALLRSIL